MSKLTIKNRFFHLAALIGTMALGSVAGCGEGAPFDTASATYALTGHSTALFGSTFGTVQGPVSDQLTPVTKITGYANGSYIFGIRLYWGTSSVLYGQTNGETGISLDALADDPVTMVRYYVSTGVLRSVKFTCSSGRQIEYGLPTSNSIAYSNPDSLLTDLQLVSGTISGTAVIVGGKFYYTTP